MASSCHVRMMEKFDQIATKLQQRIMRKERLTVSENGTYTAPENTGYTVVDVNVPASTAPALNLQPQKTCMIRNYAEAVSGVVTTPDEGYDGLESVKSFAVTTALDVEENGYYENNQGVGYNPVRVNVPQKHEEGLTAVDNGFYLPSSGNVYSYVSVEVNNVPNYVRGSGRINTKNKTISTQGQQSIMSTNVMEEDTLPLETEAQKLSFLNSTFLAYVTGIVEGDVQENPFTDTIFQVDIELQDVNSVALYSYPKINFIKKEHHQIALTNNNVTSGFEMVTFFQRKVDRCIPKVDVNDDRVVKAVLKKIYCEVIPKANALPIVLKEGTYVYCSVISPSWGLLDE